MLRKLGKLRAGGFKHLSDLVVLFGRLINNGTGRNRFMGEMVKALYREAF